MKRHRSNLLATLALVSLFSTAIAHAENWPQWRGPHFNGSSTETGLPTTFSKTDNVRWSVDLPGPAASTPVIHGDRVFLSSTDLRTHKLLALCLDRRDGKTLWSEEVATGIEQDNRSNYASPSPVTDGKRVFFFFGNGDLVAFNVDGTKLWERNIQKDYGSFAFLWTFSTSPLLHDGRLVMQVLQRDVPVSGRGRSDGPNDSYLLALDPMTGSELWKQPRPSNARAESREAFSTPVPHAHQGRSELLVAGGDAISGHDPATGTELWRWGTWNPNRITHWRLVTSPVAAEGIILACAPKGDPIYAVKAGLKGAHDDENALAWISEDRPISSDVSTPLYYQGRVFILNSDRKTIARVEPKTGNVEWVGELNSNSKLESSPTGADGKIYMMNHRGDVFVVSAGGQFELLHQVSMGDSGDSDLRSTIAVSQGNLFIRTGKKLYCIGSES
jgi:outer membrane protein assembly factor BamB